MINTVQCQDVLRRAALQATLAPSLYNTQPWRMLLSGNRMQLLADDSRQLAVHDPSGRQLIMSCGCALFNARAALAAEGFSHRVLRLPGGGRDAALAAIHPAARPDRERGDRDPADQDVADQDPSETAELSRLAAVLGDRHTNRQPFLSGALPRRVVHRLSAAAAREGSAVATLDTAARRRITLALHQDAGSIMRTDPAYRAEHRAWAATAGLIRPSEHDPCDPAMAAPSLMLLVSPQDTPADWLRTGEALERVLLELTAEGYVASLSSQVTHVTSTRMRLRRVLALDGYPQVLLQVGQAPPSPPTRRRQLVDVIVELEASADVRRSIGVGCPA
ncbi:hypothetical protein FOE78_11820 [Microlunatus elymi]|uniref:Nitroreductase family protein n=1 Tax=Microlunatus elymi TaxID=2596828 RepID=A0A516PZ92_9ACTN|nr:hypothetical protein [Microlunatus elymi]QDP96499.1 hypothetical protein FOE78_11820 [Microlunatus elymi]